jgi:hypothetical protein
MTGAIRITAVPREGHPNSGLQALYFARRYGDEVWALPAPGNHIGNHERVKISTLDRAFLKRLVPLRVLRFIYLIFLFPRALVYPGRLFIIHSFLFALPLWILRRKYCIFIHGSDRRFLKRLWGKAVARNAIGIFGIGFGMKSEGVIVREIPNIFTLAEPECDVHKSKDILFVLRNAPVKNPLYPLELAGALGEQLGLRIAVIGVDAKELPKDKQMHLHNLISRGVDICYAGRQSYESVMEWMRRSRILMIPSLSEGLPKALLEGMSQGLHVIINDPLVFTDDILARVHRVDIHDWQTVGELIKRCRLLDRNAENERFVGDYLMQSYQALIDLYDQLYAEANTKAGR